MRKFKWMATLGVLFLLTFLFFIPQASAGLGGFDTLDYDVEVYVDSRNVYMIQENIAVDFWEYHHGIYRYIPVLGTIRTEGGKAEKFLTPITDVNVPGYEYSVYNEAGNCIIRVGSEYQTVYGNQTYSLSYALNVGKDHTDTYDFFYLNAIPTDWETPINSAEITVHMPFEFDASNLIVYVGKAGSSYTGGVEYMVSGNTITCKTTRTLGYGEGVSVYIKLPEGYFTDAKGYLNVFDIALIFFSLGIGAVIVLLYLKYGKDKKPVDTVEFYPPDNINPAEAGYILDGTADKKDILSLVIYWADRGYIRITEDEKGIMLYKLASLGSDATDYERVLFNGIFAYGRNSVSLDSLTNKLYDKVNRAKVLLDKGMSYKVYNKKSLKYKALSSFLIAILLVALQFRWVVLLYQSFSEILWPSLIFIGGFFLGHLLLSIAIDKKAGKSNAYFVTMCILAYLFSGAAAVANCLFAIVTGYDPYYVSVVVSLVALVAMSFSAATKQWTEYGYTMTGRLKGFKYFIETTEAERLRAMVEQDPAYFYRILPYAYVMGVSEKWAKHFETIAMAPPAWYYGPANYYMGGGYFNTVFFIHTFGHSMRRINTAMISVPRSSGGSFSGGGGFGGGGGSGGGFGGGGGGSW